MTSPNPQVQFRRINGRIVPIKIKEGTPNQKPRETAHKQAKQLTQKIQEKGLFGNKYLNPYTVGASVLAGIGVVSGLKGVTLAIKKSGSKLYGKKGFSGVQKYITNTTNIRNRAAKQAYDLNLEAKKAFEEVSKVKSKNLFEYKTQEDLFKTAKFLSRQAAFKTEQTAKLSRNITRIKNETGYRFTKPTVDWWKRNEAKVYAGVGASSTLTAYGYQVQETKEKRKKDGSRS